MTSFTWVGGADVNGANNWITPADWLVGGLPTTIVPDAATDDVTDNADSGGRDAIISNGQAITVASLSIGNSGVATIPGGHVIVGGSPAIGGGGGGALTSAGAITVTSTNSGGGLVGGAGAVITAPSMSLSGPGVVIGGGGTFNIPNIINNGEIQADGGNYGLGGLVLNATTISGTGFIEVDGSSSVEINATTAQTVNVATNPEQSAVVIFDQPAAFTGSINLLTSTTSVDLFFKGQSPASVTYNGILHSLVLTNAGGATIDTIPFTADGTVGLAVIPSILPGYGEIALTPTNTGIVPNIPAPVNGISSTTLSAADLSALLQGNQSAMRFVSGTEAITLVDGALSVGPDTNEAFVTRLYEGFLGRAPDENGLSAWVAALNSGTSPSAVAQSFISTPEFQTAHPAPDNTSFIQALYKGMLGRAADPGGLSAWSQALAGGESRGDLAVTFANSAEAKQYWSGVTSLGLFAHNPNSAIVREDYQAAFGREADTSGLASWTSILNAGATSAQLAADFAATPEFQAVHGAQSNADYITSIYQNALGRAPDPGGLASWEGTLAAGSSRSVVLNSIAQSAEGQARLQWALSA